MKRPDECNGIAEIRAEIDRIDRVVIAALGERFEYVKAAAKFKSNSSEVAAPSRLSAMLQQRRVWAVEAGLDPDMMEKLYRDLVGYFISQEQKHFDDLRK